MVPGAIPVCTPFDKNRRQGKSLGGLNVHMKCTFAVQNVGERVHSLLANEPRSEGIIGSHFFSLSNVLASATCSSQKYRASVSI
jgi:hypothetical protein